MFDFASFFKRFFGSQREESRSAAKDRLKLILVSDRAMIAPQTMEEMRKDIIDVISKYMDIDTCSMQICLERREGAMALAANIPVRSVKRSSSEMASVEAGEVQGKVYPEPKAAESGKNSNAASTTAASSKTNGAASAKAAESGKTNGAASANAASSKTNGAASTKKQSRKRKK